MRNVRVFEVQELELAEGIYAPLLRANGVVSGRAQQRILRQVRPAVASLLDAMIVDAMNDMRGSGRARSIMRRSIVVRGTTFRNFRAYVLGPMYIKAHEDGSTIEPRRAEKLAIPLWDALRPDGSPKLPGPRSWMNIRKTFIWTSKKTGESYIVYKRTRKNWVFLYMLVDEVTLTKHKGFLQAAWLRRVPDLIDVMGRALLFEMGQVNLPGLARVTSKSGGRRRRR